MNDSFDRNLVILIFIFALSYLNYLTLKIRSKSGWSNVTCNPMSLFTNSIFQTDEDAKKDFQKCVVGISAATTTSMFRQQRNEQEKVITRLSGIEEEYDKLSTMVDGYTKEVTNVVGDYTSKIEEVKTTQKEANELNHTTTTSIDKYLGYIQGIFQNITSYFKN